MCVFKMEEGKQERCGLQIGGLIIFPWGGGSIDIYFIQLYNTSESSLQIYLELENPFSVPPYSERLKTGMRVELEVGPGSLFCSIRLWASS